MDHFPRLTHDNYTVACICPMGVELAPIEAMLDEMHQSLPTSRDKNGYTLGRMGAHNIVIAVMPEIGNNSAAAVATQLLNDFRSIRFGLLVGIGGGIPGEDEDDIRLGDIVVSKPTTTFGGVVQFDREKIHSNGRFERTGTLGKPPTVLMANVHRLEAQHRRIGNGISKYLSEMLERFPNMEDEYSYPGMEYDLLFKATYNHKAGKTCQPCDPSKIIERAPRKNSTPKIHYGTIGSANKVIKDSKTRDKLKEDLGILCVEMEAAGLMDEFSCLVVRGICDYADSHKNKRWQPYAAATAAAYAKELLSLIPAQEIVATTNAADALQMSREQDRLINELPHDDCAAFNSRLWEQEPHCLPKTRVDVLQQINEWGENAHGTCIFWLSGIAGTGKSTIARTVSHHFAGQNRLGASFFFSRGRGDLGHAGKFFTTIAIQLANTLPALKPYICEAIAKRSNIAQQGLGEQWKHLIFQPLSDLRGVSLQSQTIVLVIDALDECDGEGDIGLILQLLAKAKALETVRLRILITSRPETPIHFSFTSIPKAMHQEFILHEISESVIKHDLSIFLHHELEIIRTKFKLRDGWPGEHNIELLGQRAGELFISASTACLFIGDLSWDPNQRLSLILEDDYVGQSSIRKLDKVYTQILTCSIILGDCEEWHREKLSREFKQIVGSLVILFDSLPVLELARLFGVPEGMIHARLRSLHSILEVPKDQDRPVRLFHLSFRDFLLNKERCTNPQFWIDEKIAHKHLFVRCLELMSKHLRKDICDLRLPGALAVEVERSKVEDSLPLAVQYACRYWISHLQQSNIEICDNSQIIILEFLQEHFLHWLEALSLMRKISEGVVMVKSLQSMLTSHKHPELRAMVHDGRRFVLNYRHMIEMAPLQVYYSALIFSPTRNLIRKQFLSQIPTWIKTLPIVEDNWSLALQTLEGHSASVNDVAFSPDGRLVASCSDDNTIRLWDTTTGAAVLTIEEGPSSSGIGAVAFSPNGRLLASESNRKVRLWDATTGTAVQTLEGHSDRIWAVAFSPDGRLVASGSYDRTVRLWDATTGTAVQTLKGHSSVSEVAFSPDGRLIASGSGDGTTRLWDATTGVVVQTLEGHSYCVDAVAFSPDGRLVASGSRDKTVRLWDATTGAVLQTLESHSRFIRAVAFSPDGRLVASGSDDNTVQLWDATTGAAVQTLEGHSGSIWAIAFSPDGRLVTSGSDDNTVRLWDVITRAAVQTLKGHSDIIWAVAFSPDGRLVASGSFDKTIRFWNTTTGVAVRTLKGHSGVVQALAFSPDGRLVASGSMDKTVRLWDATTGAVLQILEGHSNCINAVAFSHDSGLVVSCSDDNTVRLWDTTTGAAVLTIEGHSNSSSVRAVAFSPDGRLVASPWAEITVRLWDTTTGATVQTLECHFRSVIAVAFSPDGRLVASGSYDRTVRLWDVQTGDLYKSFTSDSAIQKLSFSQDGSYLETNQELVPLGLPTDLAHVQHRSLYWLDKTHQWVTWNDHNILFLPPERRPNDFAVKNNVLAIGHRSGWLTFFRFSPDIKPAELS